jgi:5-oxoprolinase (ATP-hydrolysing) subunit A
MEIDLNCDLGEGCAYDAELLTLVSSASIACGFHAGDPATALTALQLAAKHGVRAGAHPSFPDREHFGRKEMARTEQQVFEDCVYQMGALQGLAKAAGVVLGHLKPHGALYNMACREDAYARPIVQAAALFELPLLGLPHSRLQALSVGRVPFIAEGFADRRYLPDGSLVPRSRPDALVEDPAEAVKRVTMLLRDRGVRTICVHGDNPKAVAFVRELRQSLMDAGYAIRPCVAAGA